MVCGPVPNKGYVGPTSDTSSLRARRREILRRVKMKPPPTIKRTWKSPQMQPYHRPVSSDVIRFQIWRSWSRTEF